jgi:hypothetical protein
MSEFDAIVRLSAIAGRSEPSHKAEMITQLLYGEKLKVLERCGEWEQVLVLNDDYVCWIRENQILRDEEWVSGYPVSELTYRNKFGLLISYGSFSEEFYSYKERSEIWLEAEKWLGVPYLWGGKTPYGVDCSGLVQLLMRVIGVRMPRDAWQQALEGLEVGFVEEVVCGDLAFFSGPNEEDIDISHVGILGGNGEIIHASGFVKCDAFDHQGIFSKEEGRYTHFLRTIRRVN